MKGLDVSTLDRIHQRAPGRGSKSPVIAAVAGRSVHLLQRLQPGTVVVLNSTLHLRKHWRTKGIPQSQRTRSERKKEPWIRSARVSISFPETRKPHQTIRRHELVSHQRSSVNSWALQLLPTVPNQLMMSRKNQHYKGLRFVWNSRRRWRIRSFGFRVLEMGGRREYWKREDGEMERRVGGGGRMCC
jgi:hypothetical protein